MTEELRQQLKTLINTFVEEKSDLDICVDKIIQLLQQNGELSSSTSEHNGQRRGSIFDGIISSPPEHVLQRRRSSTYNEQGLVNNTNTVLYDNHDID